MPVLISWRTHFKLSEVAETLSSFGTARETGAPGEKHADLKPEDPRGPDQSVWWITIDVTLLLPATGR